MRSYGLTLAALAGFVLSGLIFAAHATNGIGGAQFPTTATD